METPIYLQNNPVGTMSQGVVSFRPNSSFGEMLPPSYAGERWDNFTPWDTPAEKAAKREAEKQAEKEYQERLANISANQPAVRPVGTGAYIVMGVMMLGIGYLLLKPSKN